VIPAIQPIVRQLVVSQRTPAWVLPRFDRAVPGWLRALYRRVPLTQRLVRALQHLKHETLFLPFRHASVRRIAEAVIGLHLKRQVQDLALRRALTPMYAIGCKRLVLSDDYYPAMTQPNVTLVPAGVVRVEPDAIVTADGARHEADVIILATGFRVTDPILAPTFIGREGRSLADAWKGSPKAYMGTTVAGFPNLFVLMGPNTGLGHSSVIMMAEAQFAHVLGVLDLSARRGGGAAEPSGAAQARFVEWMDSSLATTVWLRGGCTSWYLDRTGRNSTLWPFGVDRFRRTVTRVREQDYVIEAARAAR
jgi:cation diffusion facilitator CzcD-associated flavoprotein CzcO